MKIKITVLLTVFIMLTPVLGSAGAHPGGEKALPDQPLNSATEAPGFAGYAVADSEYINKRTVSSYCCTNEALIPEGTAVTGFVLEFPGLDGNSCLGGSMDNMIVYNNSFTKECAGRGIVVAYMFPRSVELDEQGRSQDNRPCG